MMQPIRKCVCKDILVATHCGLTLLTDLLVYSPRFGTKVTKGTFLQEQVRLRKPAGVVAADWAGW